METDFTELAGMRTTLPRFRGGSKRDRPAQQKNGAKGSIESCPLEDRYKANFPFTALGIGNTQNRRMRNCNGITWEWIGPTKAISCTWLMRAQEK